MQSSITSYNHHKRLYENYLTLINGIRFTFREVDILACIVNARREKKIADICGIASTTVSTHVHNIMVKLSCNSKEQIIDFVEKAKISKVLREYYSSLLVKYNFEKILGNIASRVNREARDFYYSKDASLQNPKLFQIIKSHFKKVNINLLEFKNPTSIIDLDNIREESYYNDFFHVLSCLMNSEEISYFYTEFEESCRAAKEIHDNQSTIYINHQVFNLRTLLQENKKLVSIVAGLLSLLIVIFAVNNIKSSKSNQSSIVIQELEEFLSTSTAGQFTANNVSAVQASKNQSMIKVVEKAISANNISEVEAYFNRAEVSSEILMRYLHIIQALSLYYLYNEHDGEKSRNILLYGKNLAEHYINNRSKITIDFTQITDEELLAELKVIEHLPQLYARLLYSLGRSYMYYNDYDNLEQGKQYFIKAKYLSRQLNLFEGYMSDLNGLVPIEKRQLELLLRKHNNTQGDITKIIIRLQEIIEIYQKLRLDRGTYILDYDPSHKLAEQQTITPYNNYYNILCCENNKINIYKLLIEFDVKDKIKKYVDNIINILSKSQKFPELLKNIQTMVPRRKASLYNELGSILVILHNRGYESQKFKLFLEDAIHIKTDDNLHLAEQLFDRSRTISRKIDYTKADALDGLVKVYEQYLKLNDLSLERKQILLKKITEYSKERDLINEELRRNR